MLKLILEFYDMAQAALKEGAPIDSIAGMKIKDSLARMKEHSNDTFEQHYEELKKNMTTEFSQIKSGGDSNE